MWKEFHPEQANRGLIWKQKPDMEKGLAEPKVPLQRVGIQRSVAGRELDLAKYASETGDGRPSESPTALKQHLATHASSLTVCDVVKQIIVSYLQAPNDTYANHDRPRDPDAMDIRKIGDKGNSKGKGKGKNEKGGKGKNGDKPKRKRRWQPAWRERKRQQGERQMPHLLAHRPQSPRLLVQLNR